MKDPNNYYLFYLSGPTGIFPNRFLTYIVRDNKLDPNQFVGNDPVLVHLSHGAEYHVEINAQANLINHYITPATTGVRMPLGSFTDKDSTFPYGGIGFRTVEREIYSIDNLYVDPIEPIRPIMAP